MILGIDHGLKNIGLAISQGSLASPAGTIKVKNTSQAITAIQNIVDKWTIEKIIVGISEGKSKNRAVGFGTRLKSVLNLPVEFVDETLSTKEAKTGKRKDKSKDHEKAAAIILQRYLESLKNV